MEGFLGLGRQLILRICDSRRAFHRVKIPLCGLVLVFIYPFIFVISLWRCAFNTSQRLLGWVARASIVMFFILHYRVSVLVLMAVALLIK